MFKISAAHFLVETEATVASVQVVPKPHTFITTLKPAKYPFCHALRMAVNPVTKEAVGGDGAE